MSGLLPLLLVACSSNRVRGLILGQPVPIESSYLTVEEGAFGDDDLIVVSMSSLPSACRVQQYFEQQAALAESPEDLTLAWANAYPADFWQVDVVARVAGGSWPPKEAVWTALAWNAYPEAAGQVFATVNHHVAARDVAWWSGEPVDEDDYEHVYFSDGGAVRWGDGFPGQHLSGRMNTTLTDGIGQELGVVELFFDATPCPVVGTVSPASGR